MSGATVLPGNTGLGNVPAPWTLAVQSGLIDSPSLAHILPCPRLMVWRMIGAVTLSEI
jgi:hypothetical protein